MKILTRTPALLPKKAGNLPAIRKTPANLASKAIKR